MMFIESSCQSVHMMPYSNKCVINFTAQRLVTVVNFSKIIAL